MPPETQTNTTPAAPQAAPALQGPALNQPPAVAPATLVPANSKPLTQLQKDDLAVDPAGAAEEPSAPSNLDKANQAIQKAAEGARKFKEQKQARERAERERDQAAQRALRAAQEAEQLRQERIRLQREAEIRHQRAQSDEHLSKNPVDWLKKQSEELFQEKQRVNQVYEEVKALKDHLAAERHAAVQREAKANFLQDASNKEAYPSLQNLPPSFILAMGIQIGNAELAQGNKLSNEEILQRLEEEYAGHQTAKATVPKSPDKKKSAETIQAAATPKKADTPRTISSETNRSYSLPDDFDKMSDFQQKKELGKMLAALSKK